MRRAILCCAALCAAGCRPDGVSATPAAPIEVTSSTKPWLPSESEVAPAAMAAVVRMGVSFIPADASVVLGARVDLVLASSVWRRLAPALDNDDPACRVGFEQLTAVVVAGTDEPKMATLVAPGLGRPETLDRLQAALEAPPDSGLSAEGPVKLFSARESTYLPVHGGGVCDFGGRPHVETLTCRCCSGRVCGFSHAAGVN